MGDPKGTDTPVSTRPPEVPLSLLEWLERVYPDRCPSPHEGKREVWMHAGQAHLIRKLRTLYNESVERATQEN